MSVVNRLPLMMSLSIATSLTAVALAQEPPAFQSGPQNYVAVQPTTTPEKILAPEAVNPAPTPEPRWDGDKPFVPDAHQPQFPQPTMPQEMLDAFRAPAATAFGLFDVRVQEVRPIEQNGDTLVAIDFPEGRRIARLRRHSMREPGAQLKVDVGGGVLIDAAWPDVATYRGTIDDAPDYHVAASILDGNVSMLILPNDHTRHAWHLQPLGDGLPGMPAALHVLYRDADVVNGRHCGVGHDGPLPEIVRRDPPKTPLWTNPALAERAEPPADGKIVTDPAGNEGGIAGDEGSIAVANVRCQIALDADYEYYQACGSSVLAVIYEMERVMNHVGLIYQGQVAIAYTETFIIVRSAAADPYNTGLTGSGMRDEFRNHWVANHAGVTRDVAHLFSNRAASDGFIGFAYFAGICNNNNSANSGHCWSSTFWSADLANKVGTVAHELGHVWNATHCDGASGCGIMNSSINGSWSFGTPSANLITAHRDSRPCLDVWQNPTYVNWAFVGIENGSINNPWNTIFEGLDACLVGGTLNVQAGNYLQNPNIFKAKTINALGGTVRIGN